MSYTIDVNILLYASDDASPFHEAAEAFLRDRPRDPDIPERGARQHFGLDAHAPVSRGDRA